MSGEKERAKARRDRERLVGIDPEDDAGRWLAEHEPTVPFGAPKRATKSKLLHQWRQRELQKQKQKGG